MSEDCISDGLDSSEKVGGGAGAVGHLHDGSTVDERGSERKGEEEGWVDAKSGVREVRGRGVSPVLGFWRPNFWGSNMQSKKTGGETEVFF